jgi:hypothetical protein
MKKSKCAHPSAERVEELHAAVALKKLKASAAVTKRTTRATKAPAKAPAPQRSQATVHPDTHAASKKCATSLPAPSSDEDAEGDEDPEVEVERPEQGALCFCFTAFVNTDIH